MNASERIEPGVLAVFRLFTGIMCGLQLLRLLAIRGRGAVDPAVLALFLLTGGLFALLSWPWLRARLGARFLPTALVVASVGPILIDTLTNHAASIRGAEPAWLYFWLIPPLVIVSAQYGWRALLLFTTSTALLQLLLLGVRFERAPFVLAGTHTVARTFLFTLTGFLIMQISSAQRAQRRELAQKNAQLAHYASTQEQLAISRERNRMARELHDTLAHTLSAMSVQLGALNVLLTSDPGAAHTTVQQLQQLARDGLHESRRALQALRAQPIEALGLVQALQRLAEQTADRSGAHLQLNLPDQLPPTGPEVEQQLYRIAEEALTNSVRHAQARRLQVALTHTKGQLCLGISDDGVGFELAHAQQNGHYGLRGMHERATLIGGTLAITSRQGAGTSITVAVALPGGTP